MRGLLLSGALLVLLCSCGKPRSVPSSLSEPERKALSASLARLESVLQTRYPSVHTNLAPRATSSELEQLRAALDGNAIEVLEAWYQWHNGTRDHATGLLPLAIPLSITESLEDRAAIQAIPFVDQMRKNAVKIMDDGAGDGFFLDVTSTHPTVFYHMLEDPFPLNYGSLAQFVDFIASGFESGVLHTNSSGELDYSLDDYEAMENAYLQRIGTR